MLIVRLVILVFIAVLVPVSVVSVQLAKTVQIRVYREPVCQTVRWGFIVRMVSQGVRLVLQGIIVRLVLDLVQCVQQARHVVFQ